MTTAYPAALDALTNPTSTGTQNSPSHSAQHANANDAIEAIETMLGTGGSSPTANKVLGGSGTGTSAWLTALLLTNVISPAQLVANTDNYAPTGLATASWLRLSTDASRNLTGMTAGAAGDIKLITNIGAQNLVLVHDATSTAANRFFCPGSANFTLNANDSVLVAYDATSSRWRVLAA